MNRALGVQSRDALAKLLLKYKLPRLRDLKKEHWADAIDYMNRMASQPTATAKRVDDEIGF